MKFVLFATAAAANLCGNWAQASTGKLVLTNKCCDQPKSQNDSTSPPSCSDPLTEVTGSTISQETYRFAGDGTYAATLMIATGQSSPLDYSTGTVLFVVDTQGTYVTKGNNTDLAGGDWEKIEYTPKTFVTTVAKTNQANFFTAGQLVGGVILGPCLTMDVYLNNPSYGCPCNGTWTSGGIPSGQTTANNTRFINVSSCPMVNSTNGTMVDSCPESYFFNRATRYGSIRVTNITNNTMRLLEITQPMLDSTDGYNSSMVYANFTANFSCPSVLTPTPASSSAGSLVSSFLLAAVLAVVF